MKRFFDDMNPTVRGLGIVALIALTIVLLNLYVALATVTVLLRIAFFLAIAFVLFLLWRERRSDIATWSRRAQFAFYGGAAVIVASFAAYFWPGRTTRGLDLVAFLVTLGIAGFAMYRTWRDENTFV